MDKGHTLSQASGRVTLKELKAIIKMGLVQGNLIPAFTGAWLAIVLANHSFLSSIPQILLMMIGSTLIMGAHVHSITIMTKILTASCQANNQDRQSITEFQIKIY